MVFDLFNCNTFLSGGGTMVEEEADVNLKTFIIMFLIMFLILFFFGDRPLENEVEPERGTDIW